MPWVKLDDGFHRHRKTRKAWREPRAVGLHVMAMTYCADHLTDGFVDREWVEDQLPARAERDRVIGKLVETGMWHEHGDGWTIHDFLEFNPSADKVEAQREAKREGGRKGAARRWTHRSSDGSTHRSTDGMDDGSAMLPNPRPEPIPPTSPASLEIVDGGRSQAREATL